MGEALKAIVEGGLAVDKVEHDVLVPVEVPGPLLGAVHCIELPCIHLSLFLPFVS